MAVCRLYRYMAAKGGCTLETRDARHNDGQPPSALPVCLHLENYTNYWELFSHDVMNCCAFMYRCRFAGYMQVSLYLGAVCRPYSLM
jgi:hypothetical protein